MTNNDDLHADDLHGVIDQLRAHRPEATALELDGIKQSVRGRVAARPSGRRARSADLMKSRLAILATLVFGMLLSTTGAGLAISGLSGSGDAGVAQYGPTPQPTPPPAPTPPPTQPAQPVTPPATPAPESGAVLGETEAAQPAPEQKAAPKTQAKPSKPAEAPAPAAQPARQVEAGAGNELPFTGFAAIPILLGGIALLATGLVMRRRSNEDS